jgi:transcriptional regulator with XRE-family HTH domain
MDSETAQQRLARLVKARRLQLHLSVRAAAKAAGVDRNTWSSLEDGTRVLQDRNYAKIETALQWPTGEVPRILSAPAQSEAEAVRQRFVAMSREELAMHILDFAEARGAKEAADLLEQILAVRAEAQQRT